jgi:magnesium transporter
MAKRKKARKRRDPGRSPGSLVYTGDRTQEVLITATAYDSGELVEREVSSIDEAVRLRGAHSVLWIDVDGLQRTEVVEAAGRAFNLHPLLLEDVLNLDHRPKFEDYGDYLFFVLRALDWEETLAEVRADQISLVLGRNFVLSFHDAPLNSFEPVRQRVRSGKGRMRSMGSDYLFYALIDAAVDHCFLVLERVGERIEMVESELLESPDEGALRKIQSLKSDLVHLRRTVWPLRESLTGLLREDELVGADTRVFLRDVYDHTIQLIDSIESYLQSSSALLDIYLSSASNRMNEVMRVLTVIATIFIPLTFIAGIYGMNFEYMPELNYRWAYPAIWGVFVILIGCMLYYFKRRHWL